MQSHTMEPPEGTVDAVVVPPVKATPPEDGVMKIVPLPAAAEYVMVITPVASAIPMLVTAAVPAGAVQPLV